MQNNIRTVNIKGRKYIDVAERVRLVHEERESFEMLESKPVQMGEQWIWQVTILVDGKRFIGTAEVFLNARPGTADSSNPWSCAETSAVGRALGFANLGNLESIASADEIVRAVAQQDATQVPSKPVSGSSEPGSCTEAQKAALRRLTGNPAMDFTEISQIQAAQAIRDLQQEQNKQQRKSA